MKRRSFETEGESDVQKISKRSFSASSEELEVEECLPEEPDSEGLDSRARLRAFILSRCACHYSTHRQWRRGASDFNCSRNKSHICAF